MNDRDNIDYLKTEYMDLEYPDDLNSHVINVISSSREQYSKPNRKFRFYIPLSLGLSFILLFLVLFTKNGIYNQTADMDHVRISRFSNNINMNSLSEDEFIISVYPKDRELTLEDDIYNIDKRTGKLVVLDDILSEDIDHIQIDQDLIKELKLKGNKFYIDSNGVYVILTPRGKIILDDDLKYKVFNLVY